MHYIALVFLCLGEKCAFYLIPKSEKTGYFELRTEAHVVQITHDKSVKIDGVVYVDKDGKIREGFVRE